MTTDPTRAAEIVVEPDMSWIDLAVCRNGSIVLHDHSSGWADYFDGLDMHFEDIFDCTAPKLTTGLYRWSGYTIGSWDEGDLVSLHGGTFASLVQRPTDTARAVDELASYEKFDGVGPHAETIETRARIGERYLECYESALSDPRLKGYTPADCPSELLLDILHTWEPATPSPVTDETALSGEVDRLSQVYADATGYSENYVQFHRGLSSPSADKIRKGIRAVIAALASTPQPAAAETVERAVAAERERCAKIAEDVFSGHGKQFGTQRANNYEIAGKRIAAAIRQSAKGGE